MTSKSKLALLDDSNFPIELIGVYSNIRDVTENEKEIKELADSIGQYGLLEPIGISEKENSLGKYELIYGHRRFIAVSKILKKKFIKVVRVSEGASRSERIETQLIENIHRKDLTDLELANALQAIKGKNENLKPKHLAVIVSKSVDWVEAKLAHLEIIESLDPETKEEAKEISTEKIKHLKHLSNENKKAIIQDTKKNNLSVKKVIEKAKALSEKSVTSRKSESKPSKPVTNLRETSMEFIFIRLLKNFRENKESIAYKALVRELKQSDLQDLIDRSKKDETT